MNFVVVSMSVVVDAKYIMPEYIDVSKFGKTFESQNRSIAKNYNLAMESSHK